MEKQIQIMLDLQEQMNSKVDPNWRDANNEWYRAIWVECGEMMDHVGYKWWKKQEMDIAQVHLEIVDVMHFMLAINLQLSAEFNPKWIAEEFTRTKLLRIDIQGDIDALAWEQLENRNTCPCFAELATIMEHVNMSFDELFKQYCAKNVLNIFRQDNGYKEGTYHKQWWRKYAEPMEDNEVLAELLTNYDGTEINFMGKIRDELTLIYKQTLSQS